MGLLRLNPEYESSLLGKIYPVIFQQSLLPTDFLDTNRLENMRFGLNPTNDSWRIIHNCHLHDLASRHVAEVRIVQESRNKERLEAERRRWVCAICNVVLQDGKQVFAVAECRIVRREQIQRSIIGHEDYSRQYKNLERVEEVTHTTEHALVENVYHLGILFKNGHEG